MSQLIVFTPTYNRLKRLKCLFQTLQNQTCLDFEWLIIDDGSTDGTSEIVEQFQKEAKFSIRYEYKENGGKHTAYNRALDIMQGEGWHVTVDSDDVLEPDAVENFYLDIAQVIPGIVGVVYPRAYQGKGFRSFFSEIDKVDIPSIKLQYGLTIETCIVIDNRYLKTWRFPVFEGERALGEEILYIYLASFGEFLAVDRSVYIFEYLPDGWTRNLFKIWRQNPKGTEYSLIKREEFILENISGFRRYIEFVKARLNRNALQLTISGLKSLGGYSLLDMILFPVSILVWFKRFKE